MLKGKIDVFWVLFLFVVKSSDLRCSDESYWFGFNPLSEVLHENYEKCKLSSSLWKGPAMSIPQVSYGMAREH